MARFILRRLAFLLPQLLLVICGTFLLIRLLPVDPVTQVAGTLASKQQRNLTAHQLGLDQPLFTQLGHYLGQLLRGNLGVSWSTSTSITTEIVDRFPVTIQLIVFAFFLALAVAIPVGLASGMRRGGRTDRGTMVYSLFAGAQPDFWWGLLFIFVFSFKLGWFPTPLGVISPGVPPPPIVTHFVILDALLAGDWQALQSALSNYALPVATLAFVLSGPIIKMTRESVLAVSRSDYILYAEAAGLPRQRVRGMLLRNSMAPVVTLVGILFGFMLGGAVLIETVFSLDGLGKYALSRTLLVDFPAIEGVVVVMTSFALVLYLVMDVFHAILDPRVRQGFQ